MQLSSIQKSVQRDRAKFRVAEQLADPLVEFVNQSVAEDAAEGGRALRGPRQQWFCNLAAVGS